MTMMDTTRMDDEKATSFFRFEDLRIYDKALAYIEWVYEVTRFFPETGPMSIIGQRYLNAAHNIATSIAEGSGRNKQQFVVLLKDARAAARECIVLGTAAQRLNYLTIEKADENRELLIEISKMLGALITSLQKSGRRNENRHEDSGEESNN
jgi:four helix bundle protein